MAAAHGMGTATAAEMLTLVGGEPERICSEAAFAKLRGACLVPTFSGKTSKHRLNCGGHRQANAALHRVVVVCMRTHQPTLDYVRRRTVEGRSKRAALEALGDELEDCFGTAPGPLGNLLALARLSIRCRSLGIARLEVGPSAVAATPRTVLEALPPLLDLKNGRLLLRWESSRAEERLAAADRLLVAFAAPARKAA